MKKEIYLSLILTVALAIFGAACTSQTGSVATNSPTNQNTMNHNSMTNGNSTMNGNDMPMNSNHDMSQMSDMKSSPDAASQPYDLQFLDTMTHHHQGAIDMAKMVDGKTDNAELKKFGASIIADQNKEIAQMKDLREKWYSGKPAAKNMEMPGMMDSMKMDMLRLSNTKDKDFDLMFLDMMTPHHAGAITMSKEALTKSEKPEIKTLANQIIKAQEAEIKMMAEWKAKWMK